MNGIRPGLVLWPLTPSDQRAAFGPCAGATMAHSRSKAVRAAALSGYGPLSRIGGGSMPAGYALPTVEPRPPT